MLRGSPLMLQLRRLQLILASYVDELHWAPKDFLPVEKFVGRLFGNPRSPVDLEGAFRSLFRGVDGDSATSQAKVPDELAVVQLLKLSRLQGRDVQLVAMHMLYCAIRGSYSQLRWSFCRAW